MHGTVISYEELGLNSLAIYHDSTGGAPFKLLANGIPATYLINRDNKGIGGVVGPVEWARHPGEKCGLAHGYLNFRHPLD
jgi:hypothetical protein